MVFTTGKLKLCLPSLKSAFSNDLKSRLVHKLSCSGCTSTYIGQIDGWVAFKKAGLVGVEHTVSLNLLSLDSSSQLDVLAHDRDSLGVDRAQVGVLEQADQVALAGFPQSHDDSALEPQVSLEVLGDFSDQSISIR